MNVTVHGKKSFADGIKFRTLRWRDDSGSSEWAWCTHRGPDKRVAGNQRSRRRCDGEAEIGVMWPQVVDGWQPLEARGDNTFSSGTSIGNQPSNTLPVAL